MRIPIEQFPCPTVVLKGDGTIVHQNQAFIHLFSAITGTDSLTNIYQVVEDRWKPFLQGLVQKMQDEKSAFSYHQRECLFKAQQQSIPCMIFLKMIDKDQFLLNMIDISNYKTIQEKYAKIFYLDQETGLPKTTIFDTKLERLLFHALYKGKRFYVVFLEIKRFPSLYHLIGEQKGKELIRDLVLLLQASMGDRLLARINEYTFGILYEPQESIKEEELIQQWEKLSQNIKTKLNQKYPFTNYDLTFLIAPIGGPSCQKTIAEIKSDLHFLSEYIEKRKEIPPVVNSSLRQKKQEYIETESLIKKFIQEDRFRLFAQPIIDIVKEQTIGYEVLLRWPENTQPIDTETFISIAEDSDLILEIDDWVFRQIVGLLAEKKLPQKGLYYSINLSAKNILHPGFVDRLLGQLTVHAIPRRLIRIEFTERISFYANRSKTKEIFDQLQKNRIQIIIDDFGMEYSSLSLLKDFPVQSIKIDKGFSQQLNKKRIRKLIYSIIEMARHLGIEVIIEGIEKKSQLAIVKNFACRYFQGFFFSKPVPIETLYRR